MGFKIIVIGASLGGAQALRTILSALPTHFSVPVAIVQHRDSAPEPLLSNFLRQNSALPLIEVEDKEGIVPGKVYLAPAAYHLLIESTGHFALSTEAPILYARPAIDVLFESAADAYAASVIGVILTGASRDGAAGLAAIKAQGGLAVIQDPTTAESPTMPKAAIAAVDPDWVLPITEIAPLLVTLCHPGER